MKVKTHKKLNITIPLDVYKWAVDKQEREQKKTRFGKVHLSNILADCVAEMMRREQAERLLLNNEPGNPQALPHTGAEILRPRKISAGGSGTPTIRYPKKQRGKSSK